MLYFFSISVAGIVIQLVNIDIKSELFAEALALMGLMLAVESEDDRMDADTGVYNRRALQMDVHNYFAMKESLPLIFIKLANTDRLIRVTGTANDDDITAAVVSYLKTLIKRYRIYHPNEDCFILTFDQKDGEKAKVCAEQMSLIPWIDSLME